MSPLNTALGYIKAGMAPVPVPHRKKGPVIGGWQKLRLTESSAPPYFNGGPMNIGVLLGEPSGWLADVDLDCAEARKLASYYLPPTGKVFGRESAPKSHRIYRSKIQRTVELKDPETGDMVVELRSTGAQTIFPGSTHTSGEPIEWAEDGDPGLAHPPRLIEAVELLAAASTLARCAPGKGRHAYFRTISGWLLRSGWTKERVRHLLMPVAMIVLDDRGGQAAGEIARLCEPATGELPGFTSVVECLGEKRARKVSEWLRLTKGQDQARHQDDGSHDALALEMGQEWSDARHVALWGRWLFYAGSRWETDEKLHHMTRARDFLRRKAQKAAADAAKQLRSAQTVAYVVNLARSNPEQVATAKQWDADPWLLGTPTGVVDLRTGKLRPADPLDYITKQTAVAPAPPGTPAPLWTAFLDRIFRHDPELIPYMRRVAGYSITGETSEHALVFGWGEGGNGKSVLFNALAHVLADYAAIAAADMLLVTNTDRHPTDMAMLRGARLVIASELAPGRAWDEPKLKSLTGGDPVTARFMRQDFFTYQPQFTLLVAGNHKASVKSVDQAIKRRVQLVPFLQNIPEDERDPALAEKLRGEAPAILRWAIDGCRDWQRQGLNPPKTVREASQEYLDAEDVLGQWLAERCVVGLSQEASVGALYADWVEWSETNGQRPGSAKAFSQRLSERGFKRSADTAKRAFLGLGLLGLSTSASSGSSGSPLIDRTIRPSRARTHAHAHTSYKQGSAGSAWNLWEEEL
jgi:P4 family phage/plasmid primase-like protien